MKNLRFVFVGNRRPVLDEMIKNGLNIIKVFAMEIGYLAKTINSLELDYSIIYSKKELIQQLEEIDFDILISNGCQFILPISKLKNAHYINIHPSPLPDLKGRDPSNGSILLKRDSGATCHIMDDKIDNGDIIHQVRILYNEQLDAAYLYQLCFMAEVICFKEALKNNFKPILKQQPSNKDIYYSMQLSDRIIKFKSEENILNQIKAFNTLSKGCFFKANNTIFRVFEADILHDKILKDYYNKESDCKVLLKYEGNIVFKLNNNFLRFKKIDGNLNNLYENSILLECDENEI